MKIQMILVVNGVEYKAMPADYAGSDTIEVVAESWYKLATEWTKMKVQLEDGSYMVLGPVISQALAIFREVA